MKLQVGKSNSKDEIVPEPEDGALKDGREHDRVQIDSVPEEVVVVDDHLNALEREEIIIACLGQSFDELASSLALLM